MHKVAKNSSHRSSFSQLRSNTSPLCLRVPALTLRTSVIFVLLIGDSAVYNGPSDSAAERPSAQEDHDVLYRKDNVG